MPILKNLRALNWPGLAVELVLIFVGITAALWFDSLSQDRADRRTEEQVLGELVQSLRTDTADLSLNLNSSAQTLSSIDTILAYLDGGRPYRDELADHFRAATMATNFIQNLGTYEYLKSIGLGIIRDDALRARISHYYEYRVPYLTGVEALFVNGNWSDVVQPQMMEKFSYQFLFEPAAPHDYASLLEDREYRTMLLTTREVLRWKDRLSRGARTDAEALIAAAEAHLSTF